MHHAMRWRVNIYLVVPVSTLARSHPRHTTHPSLAEPWQTVVSLPPFHANIALGDNKGSVPILLRAAALRREHSSRPRRDEPLLTSAQPPKKKARTMMTAMKKRALLIPLSIILVRRKMRSAPTTKTTAMTRIDWSSPIAKRRAVTMQGTPATVESSLATTTEL